MFTLLLFLTLWVFGGEYHVEHEQPGLKNDLWKYDLYLGTWELAHNGTSPTHHVPAPRQLAAGCGVMGSYFLIFGGLAKETSDDEKQQQAVVLGDTWLFSIPDKQWLTLDEFLVKVGAENESDLNTPAARGDMAFWCQENSQMIVFGGFGNNNNLHNDLWTFSLQTLKWKQSTVSSTIPKNNDFVSHIPYPAGRSGATTWVVNSDLFMFGGNIDPKNVRSKHLMVGNVNEMWHYNLETDQWNFVSGEKTMCTKAGVYGELGTASQGNSPGCRRRAAGWIDRRGNLWMFGGDGVDSSQTSVSVFQHSKLLSDVWYFDRDTQLWTWKGGDNIGDKKGQFGDKGEQSRDFRPGGRSEAVVWGAFVKLYLLGGIGHDKDGKDGYLDDIWELDVELDPSVERNSPYAGPVFSVIIFGVGLVIFVVLLFFFGLRFYPENSSHRDIKYSQIPLDAPEL